MNSGSSTQEYNEEIVRVNTPTLATGRIQSMRNQSSAGSAGSSSRSSNNNTNTNNEIMPIKQLTICTNKQEERDNHNSHYSSEYLDVPDGKIMSSRGLNDSDTIKINHNQQQISLKTSKLPTNQSELMLYRLLERANLLCYFETFVHFGGDDVQQLCDAEDDEFLEIMDLVGMAKKPLHVRRLQKTLLEWKRDPDKFTNTDSTSLTLCGLRSSTSSASSAHLESKSCVNSVLESSNINGNHMATSRLVANDNHDHHNISPSSTIGRPSTSNMMLMMKQQPLVLAANDKQLTCATPIPSALSLMSLNKNNHLTAYFEELYNNARGELPIIDARLADIHQRNISDEVERLGDQVKNYSQREQQTKPTESIRPSASCNHYLNNHVINKDTTITNNHNIQHPLLSSSCQHYINNMMAQTVRQNNELKALSHLSHHHHQQQQHNNFSATIDPYQPSPMIATRLQTSTELGTNTVGSILFNNTSIDCNNGRFGSGPHSSTKMIVQPLVQSHCTSSSTQDQQTPFRNSSTGRQCPTDHRDTSFERQVDLYNVATKKHTKEASNHQASPDNCAMNEKRPTIDEASISTSPNNNCPRQLQQTITATSELPTIRTRIKSPPKFDCVTNKERFSPTNHYHQASASTIASLASHRKVTEEMVDIVTESVSNREHTICSVLKVRNKNGHKRRHTIEEI